MSRQVFINGFSLLIMLSIEKQSKANTIEPETAVLGASIAQIQTDLQKASGKSVKQSSIATSLKGLISKDLAERHKRESNGAFGKGARSSVFFYDLTPSGRKDLGWMMKCINCLQNNS